MLNEKMVRGTNFTSFRTTGSLRFVPPILVFVPPYTPTTASSAHLP